MDYQKMYYGDTDLDKLVRDMTSQGWKMFAHEHPENGSIINIVSTSGDVILGAIFNQKFIYKDSSQIGSCAIFRFWKSSPLVLIVDESDREVWAVEGYGPGSPSVNVEWGFSTGSNTGQHSFCDSFAYAELGILDEDCRFERIGYTKENSPNRQVIGWPKKYEAWSPDGDEDECPDWHNDLNYWIKKTCEDYLLKPSTNWGGHREGAGRPVTGRKKRQYYVTDAEDAQIRQLINSLRNQI